MRTAGLVHEAGCRLCRQCRRVWIEAGNRAVRCAGCRRATCCRICGAYKQPEQMCGKTQDCKACRNALAHIRLSPNQRPPCPEVFEARIAHYASLAEQGRSLWDEPLPERCRIPAWMYERAETQADLDGEDD